MHGIACTQIFYTPLAVYNDRVPKQVVLQRDASATDVTVVAGV